MSIKIYNLQSHNNIHISPSGDLYVSEGYFVQPSVMMRNLENGHKMNGEMDCLNYKEFKCVDEIDDPVELRKVIVKLTEMLSSRDIKYNDLVDKHLALQINHMELLDKNHKLQERINDMNHPMTTGSPPNV